ncbi:MAG TPA: [protein-PII] uridylyltransferase [Caulobacteraceae bacterium]|jgi:[protein-PII] uridylyltransferase
MARPPRTPPLPDPLTAIDGQGLRAALTAAFRAAEGNEAEQRRLALAILKDALNIGRAEAERRLASHGGLAAAQALSATADAVVQALHAFTTLHVARASNPTEGERLALVAVGGYGRGALAPYSDIDLLFLRAYKQSPHTESVAEYMLYVLWDLSLKVGHASRTVEECLKLADANHTVKTSLVDARPLAGDERLFRDLRRAFRAHAAGDGPAFVAAKLAERDGRHARAGASRYLVEPNVKESKGGLRDLHVLLWIAGYLHPDGDKGPDMRRRLKGFDRREIAALWLAADFLWAARSHLHFAAGRAQEKLTFEWQPEIARRMGFGDGGPGAVKRLMRRYFHTAREVGALTRALCAQLEAERAKARPEGLSRFLPRIGDGSVRLAPGFRERVGRLDVDGDRVFRRDPANLVRLFQLADRHDLDLHPHALTSARRNLPLMRGEARRNPAAVAAFLDILMRGRNPYRALSLMNESGVLGRFIPEFGRIVGESQFDRHHAYTVDEHTLQAVSVMADLARGRLADEHPLAVKLIREIADREAMFLAMLLHDVGKGRLGGQEEAGAKAARTACLRLGLSPERAELVAWLVGHHLLMSETAQKRDLSDPRTIERFAAAVAGGERLRMLLVLTVADIRSVAPGVWNGWKGQLLRELYTSTDTLLRGGGEGEMHGRAERELRRRASLIARSEETGAAAEAGPGPGGSTTEIAVAVHDRPGLFADLAAALAAYGAEVVGAEAHTTAAGQVLDLFQVQDAAGQPFPFDARPGRASILEALEEAARGRPPRLETRRRSLGARSRASAYVQIDQQASRRSTVVEASGGDRPGLLTDLARAIASEGLSIRSAHISSYGDRVSDVFYVQTDVGARIPPEGAEALRRSLLQVLSREAAKAHEPAGAA